MDILVLLILAYIGWRLDRICKVESDIRDELKRR